MSRRGRHALAAIDATRRHRSDALLSCPYLAGWLSGCQRRGGRIRRDDGIVMCLHRREERIRALPRVTFTDPEIGAVGPTEAQAQEANLTVRTAVSPIPSSSRGWIHGPGNDGLIKLVANADAGVLLGHIGRACRR